MALFGLNKKEKAKTTSSTKEGLSASVAKKVTGGKTKVVRKDSPSSAGGVKGFAHVLRRPRITEKATMHTDRSVYLFDVAPNATKYEIARAVYAVYNVTPRMVHVVTIPTKQKRSVRTGGMGTKTGGKKAYVYLKKGETITIT